MSRKRSCLAISSAARVVEAAMTFVARNTDAARGVDLLGYSMGGRVASYVACLGRSPMRRLVLENSALGIADPVLVMLRAARDERLAASLEREGLESFLARWERLSLFASQRLLDPEVLARQRRRRRGNAAAGLAASLRGMGGARQPWLGRAMRAVSVPTLFIGGALDRKYLRVGRALVASMPSARLVVVEGAGHNVHLEAPQRHAALVEEFLSDDSP